MKKRNAYDRVSVDEAFAAFDDSLSDWQIAGLAVLLFKGGIFWDQGSWAVEGKANLKKYQDAASAQNKVFLEAYLDNVFTALNNDANLQNQLAATHAALKNFIAAMVRSSPWTYCGTLDPATLVSIVK